LEEQVMPIAALGTSYVVGRSPVRSAGGFQEADVVRFVGAADVTQVTTNLPAPLNSFTLQPGEVQTAWSQGHVIVTATKPLVVSQLQVSYQLASGTEQGDPSLVIIPSVQNYTTAHAVTSPAGWTSTHFVITHPAAAKLSVDGAPPAGCNTVTAGTIAATSFAVTTCSAKASQHRVASDLPIGVIVYGYGVKASFAYPAAAKL
jgi:hypothetical protein